MFVGQMRITLLGVQFRPIVLQLQKVKCGTGFPAVVYHKPKYAMDEELL